MTLPLAPLHEAVAAALPEREAIVFRDRRLTYAEVAERSRRLANFLLSQDITIHRPRSELENWESGQDHVALYMFNCNEYVEALLGGYKARAVPFNVNYRYVREELEYLLNDADAKAIVYHGCFAPVVREVLADVPTCRLLIQVDDGSGQPLLEGAFDYEAVLAESSPGPTGQTCEPDDLFILYTGGTTGMPRGVLWRQADAYLSQMGGRYDGVNVVGSLDEAVRRAVNKKRYTIFPPPPFMHGAGKYLALRTLFEGNTLLIQNVTDRFDPADVLSLAEKERANLMLAIGDAFGRPLLDELRRKPYDTSSLKFVTNTGAIMSKGVKAGLMEMIPGLTIIDSLGSSETGIQAQNVSGAKAGVERGDFRTMADTRVMAEDRRRFLEPGEPAAGWLAIGGRVPYGYYGDEAKTKETFPEIAGVRYVIGGDKVRLLENGEIEYFGRDSVTINSGGEKIFAEEVEEALKHHPAVADVLVAGRPSERWGQEVVALVQLANGASPDPAALNAEAAKHIARYKLPKAFRFVDRVGRSANGKPDYRWAKQQAEGAA
ncbi:acyl-CoA synthetase [Minwuia thermotolerans]|uniref:Acyl-CoA synthetase n=1 Tax=Minwuia thermotolerans TaxID=2056226 RepID=A0A2M9G539_9PROT|nr:acyl-CoA synthetase [Minwuia thermotolerans]PJK30833.1 acyl-CoA synthetase [Minwuia thermotolerans]